MNNAKHSYQSFSRRRFLRGIGVAGVATTLIPMIAACQPATTVAPAQSDSSAPASAQEATDLVFWRYPSQPQDPVLEDFVQQYTDANTGASVEVAAFGPLAEYRQKVLAAIAANTGPDCLLSDGPWLPEFADRSILNPAPPEVAEDVESNFTEGGKAYVTFRGTVYGYPWDTNVHQLFMNNAYFAEAGLDPENPPINSWAEFREAANQLAVSENGSLTRAGFLANPRLLYLADFLYNNNGAVINEDAYGNLQEPVVPTLLEDPAMETWNLWYSLYNEDGAADATFPSHTDSFTQGLSAMIVSGNFFISGLEANAPDLEYTIAPIPTNTGNHQAILGGWMWAVMEASENKAAAWELVRNSNTAENLLNSLNNMSWLITRTGVLEDSALSAMLSPQLQKFYDALPSITHVRAKTVIYQQLESGIDPIIQQLLLDQLSPEEAAQQANDAAAELIEESGGI